MSCQRPVSASASSASRSQTCSSSSSPAWLCPSPPSSPASSWPPWCSVSRGARPTKTPRRKMRTRTTEPSLPLLAFRNPHWWLPSERRGKWQEENDHRQHPEHRAALAQCLTAGRARRVGPLSSESRSCRARSSGRIPGGQVASPLEVCVGGT